MDEVRALAERLEIPLQDDAAERLGAFLKLAALWGKRIDLTSARDNGALAEILFVDALHMVSVALVPENARVLDVGAGVGAPTLPMLLLRPDLRALLVEPRRKRVAFLRTAVGSLGLAQRVQVVEAKLGLDAPLSDSVLTVDDIVATIRYMVSLHEGRTTLAGVRDGKPVDLRLDVDDLDGDGSLVPDAPHQPMKMATAAATTRATPPTNHGRSVASPGARRPSPAISSLNCSILCCSCSISPTQVGR